MNYFRLLLVMALAWYCSGSEAMAQRRDDLRAPTPSKVGMVTRNFTDEQRKNWQGTAPRPLLTAIWYPAAATATKEETIFGGPPEKEVFAPVTVAPGAEISPASRKYPLILLSHGTG